MLLAQELPQRDVMKIIDGETYIDSKKILSLKEIKIYEDTYNLYLHYVTCSIDGWRYGFGKEKPDVTIHDQFSE